MEEQTTVFYRFGVALFIGILIGLQREYSYDEAEKPDEKTFAGVRTFALLGLTGCAAAFAAELLKTPWAFVGILVAVGALIVVAYFILASQGAVGMTTEVAAILALLAGALCFWDQVPLAVAIGVITTALLSLKIELHGFVARLTREDIIAALKFAIITAIVLPILPDRNFGPPPFDVLNPYKIWLMVVLISGISFLGYVLFKLLGPQRGIGLTGVLGGLASSTATTMSFSQRSQKGGRLAKSFALAITVAWTVMFIRVMIEVGAIHLPLLEILWLPMVATGLVALIFCLFLYFAPRVDDEEDVLITNPFELRPAITFGLLYGLILLIARAAQVYFGNAGVYVSSIVSGFADVDAITLSMTELGRSGNLDLSTAAKAIILAVMSNTLVKSGIIITSGSSALRRTMIPGILLILATGLAFALFLQ